MQRTHHSISITNTNSFKQQALLWAQPFDTFIWFDSNAYADTHGTYEAILAVGCESQLTSSPKNAFQKLKTFRKNTQDFIFGFLGYDLKNDIEKLKSENIDGPEFPDLFFFQPQKIIFIEKKQATFSYLKSVENSMQSDIKNIKNQIQKSFKNKEEKTTQKNKIQQRVSKKQYLKNGQKILKHILLGDIYEANYCHEYYIENQYFNTLELYQKFNKISQPPFSVFLKQNNQFLLSSSPERYLKKEGHKIISQPIKGTIKRAANEHEDLQLKNQLKNDLKELTENIMVVDLVRNDLSKIATKGSVHVEELCKPYTFKQVHQLISTVAATVDDSTDPVNIIKSTFPMASMTGMPKLSAMKIIETYEASKRGLYSGAVGYFTPNNDFDFSVVIRSIIYNQNKKHLSFSVGSAITANCKLEKEYEECQLKAKAMIKVLTE